MVMSSVTSRIPLPALLSKALHFVNLKINSPYSSIFGKTLNNLYFFKNLHVKNCLSWTYTDCRTKAGSYVRYMYFISHYQTVWIQYEQSQGNLHTFTAIVTASMIPTFLSKNHFFQMKTTSSLKMQDVFKFSGLRRPE